MNCIYCIILDLDEDVYVTEPFSVDASVESVVNPNVRRTVDLKL